MVRYARAGKGSTHQRVAKEPTPWNEMKPPPPERLRGNKDKMKDNGKPFKNKFNKKERFSRQKGSEETDLSAPSSSTSPHPPRDRSSENGRFKNSNSKIRGFGQSKSIQIFGQFWVPLEDAKRLKNLLKKLKDQGLPRKEILEVLKNDRRKAEKAAKRQRDKTCFQCRQFGHVLSDCPNLRKAMAGPSSSGADPVGDSSEMAVEICFKCGSTEHTSRKCRRKGETFSFAKCFICSGTGHIARQCPQNSKGIYPSGGSCGECGSSMHLKQDCPDLVGVEQSGGAAEDDDPNAVTLRMSDPFASTEYEPVFDLDDKKEMEADGNDKKRDGEGVEESPKSEKLFKQMPNNKKKKGNKRKMIDEELDSQSYEFGLSNAPVKHTPPIKRKIVKF